MLDVSKVDLTRVYDICAKIVDLYRKELEDLKINASGQLSRTADFDIDYDEYTMTVYMLLENYAWYIEKGRKASTGKFGNWATKYADIEKWLREKISRGSFVPSGSHKIPRTEREIKRTAGAIVHKITKVGYYGSDHHGQHPLQNAMDIADSLGLLDEIVDIVVREFVSTVDIEIETI